MPRCENDDPNRCQAVFDGGQCQMLSKPGEKFCPSHNNVSNTRKTAKRIYNLQRWNDRIKNHAEHEMVKSLREEIGILRMMLEARLDQCTEQSDFVTHTGAITNLVDKIERTVSSCHKLESSMGQLMDKQALIQFADTVISAVGEIFPDATPEQMTRLGLRITSATEPIPEEPTAPLPEGTLGGLDDDES